MTSLLECHQQKYWTEITFNKYTALCMKEFLDLTINDEHFHKYGQCITSIDLMPSIKFSVIPLLVYLRRWLEKVFSKVTFYSNYDCSFRISVIYDGEPANFNFHWKPGTFIIGSKTFISYMDKE